MSGQHLTREGPGARCLDEIKSRLPVSEVARRLVPSLKKAGAEFKGLSPFHTEKTPSFTVNDRKAMWYDFSSGQGGDIFDLEQKVTGCSFAEALQRLAADAGVDLPKPNGKGRGGNGAALGPYDEDEYREPSAPEPERLSAKEAQRRAIQGEPAAVYDYKDAEGRLVYQKLRFEWQHEGRRHKTFVQRREIEPGEYAYSLGEGEFFRAEDGSWRRAKDGHRGPTRRLPAAPRVPYNLGGVLSAIELGDPVFACEGEKDADTLAAEGLAATCSVGGGWDEIAPYLSRADVIQLLDNDPAGEQHGQKLGYALRPHVKSHRLLRFPELPPKGDVTDWIERGGTAEQLFERINSEAVDWTPARPASAFDAVYFSEIGRKRPERNWSIKNLLLASVFGLVYGPPACGKSFLITDMMLTLAWATINPQAAGEWFGHRIRRPSGVVYIASEAPEDFEIRLHAWRTRNDVSADVELPFVFLPTTIDMQSQRAETARLIEEIRTIDAYYRAKFGVGVGVVAVDTVSRALAGGNENAPDVMGAFVSNCEALRRSIDGMAVIGVHHSPIDGTRPRGHGLLHGAADIEIEVRKAAADKPNCWIVRKNKSGPEGAEHHFRLEVVSVGEDADNEPITSCVISGRMASDAARQARERPKGEVRARQNEIEFLRALSTAIERQGVTPPAAIKVPGNIEAVVEPGYVRDIYMEQLHLTEHGEATEAIEAKLRARWARATKAMLRFNVIGHAAATGSDGEARRYLWFTGRPVSGNVTIRGVRVTDSPQAVTKPGKDVPKGKDRVESEDRDGFPL